MAFQHILVPTDFGETADRVADFAIALAHKCQAKLTFLHVYPIPTSGYGYAEGLQWSLDDLQRAAQAELDRAVQSAKARYENVGGILDCGEPWEKILEVARREHADLIVVGTHGRRGVLRALLGSVAERIVRMSPVPVLTVCGHAAGHGEKAQGFAQR